MASNDSLTGLSRPSGRTALRAGVPPATAVNAARRERPAGWRAASTALVAALAIAGIALATQMPGDRTARPAASVRSATGGFTMSNSKNGQAVLVAQDVGPGSSASGQTTIANNGQATGWFELSKAGLADQPGPGGGRLSDLADLVVSDITQPGAPVTVYAGKLAAMPNLPLGAFNPGEAHTYSFAVSLPRNATPVAPTGDINGYQSSRLQVDYNWTGSDTDPGPAPPPPSSDPTPVPPTPTDPSPGQGSGSPSPAGGSPSPAGESPGPTGATAGTEGRPAPAPQSGGPSTGSAGASRRTPGASARRRTASSAPSATARTPKDAGHQSGAGHGGSARGHRRSGVASPRRPRATGAPVHHDTSPLSSVLDLAGKAAKAAAFPSLLFLIMVGFFYAQNWLDRRDPKLALAPVEPEPRRSFN